MTSILLLRQIKDETFSFLFWTFTQSHTFTHQHKSIPKEIQIHRQTKLYQMFQIITDMQTNHSNVTCELCRISHLLLTFRPAELIWPNYFRASTYIQQLEAVLSRHQCWCYAICLAQSKCHRWDSKVLKHQLMFK